MIGNRDRYACQGFLREINKFLYEQRREDVQSLSGSLSFGSLICQVNFQTVERKFENSLLLLSDYLSHRYTTYIISKERNR